MSLKCLCSKYFKIYPMSILETLYIYQLRLLQNFQGILGNFYIDDNVCNTFPLESMMYSPWKQQIHRTNHKWDHSQVVYPNDLNVDESKYSYFLKIRYIYLGSMYFLQLFIQVMFPKKFFLKSKLFVLAYSIICTISSWKDI